MVQTLKLKTALGTQMFKGDTVKRKKKRSLLLTILFYPLILFFTFIGAALEADSIDRDLEDYESV